MIVLLTSKEQVSLMDVGTSEDKEYEILMCVGNMEQSLKIESHFLLVLGE